MDQQTAGVDYHIIREYQGRKNTLKPQTLLPVIVPTPSTIIMIQELHSSFYPTENVLKTKVSLNLKIIFQFFLNFKLEKYENQASL